MSEAVTTYYPLDHNGLYRLKVHREDDRQWDIALESPEGTYPPFLEHLSDLITLEDDNGRQCKLDSTGRCSFEGKAPISVFVDDHKFGRITKKNNAKPSDLLTVSETRLIGEMPGGRGAIHRNRGKEVGVKEGAVFTDFHTHSSSEISGRDLVELGVQVGATYPVRLLNEIGIDTKDYPLHTTERIWFPPLEPNKEAIPRNEHGVRLADMSPKEREKLAQALNVRADRQGTTGEMELDYYRLRNPLTKRPDVFRPMLYKIAEQYKANGIKYAELTITLPDNPELLRRLHNAVPEIKEQTGVDLRFLIGMPRTLPKEKLHTIIEKTKILSESPYILGLDVIGYEVNKTKEFYQELNGLAEWIQAENPDFTLRVHAGENAKNLENVRDVLEIANRHDVRTRIGHAVYGVHDNDTIKLAKELAGKGKLVLEFNIDSNLALNNIDSLHIIPLEEYTKEGIAFVIGSDGNGFYQTSPRQLEKGLEHVGVTDDVLKSLKKTQKGLMEQQLAYSHAKLNAVTQQYPDYEENADTREAYVNGLLERCNAVNGISVSRRDTPPLAESIPQDVELVNHEGLPELLGNRKPVLLLGASGSSWARIPKGEPRTEIKAAVDMLAHVLDSEKVFFVFGRAKNEGISKVLEKTMIRMQQDVDSTDTSQRPFYVMSLLTPHAIRAFGKNHDDNNVVHLHYIKPIEDNFVALPARLVQFAKKHGGEIIGVGGAAFTRDVILKARHEGADFQVMSRVAGASEEKGRMLEDRHKSGTAIRLIEQMFESHPDWFLPRYVSQEGTLDKEAVNALYEEAKERVHNKLGYQSAGTTIACGAVTRATLEQNSRQL